MSSTYQVIQEEGIRLNANESPFPISEACLKEVIEAVNTIEFHRYPDDSHQQLKEAYAKYLGLQKEQLIMGNGSDEMIGLIIATQIKENDCVYTMDPDFSMYDYYTSLHGGHMATYEYPLNSVFDVNNFIENGKKANAKLVIFSNPNNPSGQCASETDIKKIIEAFHDRIIVIDEAYGEFNDFSMLPYLNEYKNLIVLRTMSKAFGMAAIRCGCMAACEATVSSLISYKVPYNINSFTQVCAVILLKHTQEMKQNIDLLIKERDTMYQKIKEADLTDITIYPSKANYLYGTSSRKQELLDALKQHNILIRNYANNDSFRISIGAPKENELVLEIMKSVFQVKHQ